MHPVCFVRGGVGGDEKMEGVESAHPFFPLLWAVPVWAVPVWARVSRFRSRSRRAEVWSSVPLVTYHDH